VLKDACLTRERVTINGPAGALVGELDYPASDPASYLAVIANPHPLMGGTMENNVVVALAESLPRDGCATLRFDYGGVGLSGGDLGDVEAAMAQFWQTGTAPQDEGLIDDLHAVVRWARRNVLLPIVLVGYSFGAYAAARVAASADIARVVLVAPTLSQHAFPDADSARPSMLVVFGDDDFATPRERTQAWIGTRAFPPQWRCVAGGDHFFRRREAEVCEACAAFITSSAPGRAIA
jgi:alpha/beta superfamily hydrolase